MERRFVRQATEVRSAGNKLEGYAAVFNTEAQLPGFRETIRSGAFTRALREKQDCVCLFNHNANFPLGRTTAGTLRLSQDSKGLFYSVDLPNTSFARDLHESIRRGDVCGSSFAFTVPGTDGQRWSEQRDGSVLREICDVDLMDVSPVTHPAYEDTEVNARQFEQVLAEVRSRRSSISPVEIQVRELLAKAAELRKSANRLAVRDAGIRNRRLGLLDLL